MSTYRGVAEANERIVADGGYVAPSGTFVRIGAAVADACMGTVSYGPTDLERLLDEVKPGEAETRIEVTGESSMAAARRLHGERANRIAVLNFASARNAGGGYLGGARALSGCGRVPPEPDWCRRLRERIQSDCVRRP